LNLASEHFLEFGYLKFVFVWNLNIGIWNLGGVVWCGALWWAIVSNTQNQNF